MANDFSFLVNILGSEKAAVSAIDKVRSSLKGAAKDSDKLGNSSSKSSGVLQSGMQSAAVKIGALTASMYATKKTIDGILGPAISLESAIDRVASVSGSATEELNKLAREAGKNTIFSATESADALLLLAQAGLKVDAMSSALTPTLNLAAAANIDLAESTQIVVDTTQAFGKEMSSATDVADLYAKVSNSASTTVSQLGQAMTYAAPVAKQFGVSIEDTSSILALLANNGIKAERAGTAFRGMMSRLANPSNEVKEALKGAGISLKDVKNNLSDPIKLFKILQPILKDNATAVKVVGLEAQSMLSVISKVDALEKFRKELDKNKTTVKELADKQIDNASGQVKLLKSAFEELTISLSTDSGAVSIFTDFVKTLKDMAIAAVGLPGPLKKIGVAAIVLTPAIIGLNIALGPIGLVLAGIGVAAVAAAVAFQRLKVSAEDLQKMEVGLDNQKKRLDEINKRIDERLKKDASRNKLIEDEKVRLTEINNLIKEKEQLILNADKLRASGKQDVNEFQVKQEINKLGEEAEKINNKLLAIKNRQNKTDYENEKLLKEKEEVERQILTLNNKIKSAKGELTKADKEQLALLEKAKKGLEDRKLNIQQTGKEIESTTTSMQKLNMVTGGVATMFSTMEGNAAGLFGAMSSGVTNVTSAFEKMKEVSDDVNSSSGDKMSANIGLIGAIVSAVKMLGDAFDAYGKDAVESNNKVEEGFGHASLAVAGVIKGLMDLKSIAKVSIAALAGAGFATGAIFKGIFDSIKERNDDTINAIKDTTTSIMADINAQLQQQQFEAMRKTVDMWESQQVEFAKQRTGLAAIDKEIDELERKEQIQSLKEQIATERDLEKRRLAELKLQRLTAAEEFEKEKERIEKEAAKKRAEIQIKEFELQIQLQRATIEAQQASALAQASSIIGRTRRKEAKADINDEFAQIYAALAKLKVPSLEDYGFSNDPSNSTDMPGLQGGGLVVKRGAYELAEKGTEFVANHELTNEMISYFKNLNKQGGGLAKGVMSKLAEIINVYPQDFNAFVNQLDNFARQGGTIGAQTA